MTSPECLNCSQPLLPGAEFCASCGQPVGGPPQPQGPQCQACGQALIDGAAFCAACGTPHTASTLIAPVAYQDADAPLPAHAAPADDTELPTYAPPADRPKRRLASITIVLGVIGVLVVVLAAVTFALGGKKTGTSASPSTVSPTTLPPTTSAPTTSPPTEPPTTSPDDASITDSPVSDTTTPPDTITPPDTATPPDTGGFGGTEVSVQAHVEVDNSGLFIRSAPSRTSGREVLLLAAGDDVTISCTSQGDAVSGSSKSSTLWDWLWAPATGYVPDALLDTPDGGPPVADCGGSPPDPPTPPPYAGVLKLVTATPGLYVRPSPDITSTPSSDLKTGAGVTVYCTLPGTAVDGSGGTELWDRLLAPSPGYVADRYLSSTSDANIQSC